MSSDNNDDRPMPGPAGEGAARTATRMDDPAATGAAKDDDRPTPTPTPGPGGRSDSDAQDGGNARHAAPNGADSSPSDGSDGPAVDVSDIDPNPTNEDDADAEQDRIDRSKIDFDPDEGLYSGTAVDGTSDIPGPHEQGEDVMDDRPQKGDEETSENDPDGAGGDSDDNNAAGDAEAREVPSDAEQKQAEQQEHANQGQAQDRTSH